LLSLGESLGERQLRALVFFAILFATATPAAASETITYAYDALGRLVAVSRSGTVNNGASASYGYDPANNRTSVTSTAGGAGMAAGTQKNREIARPVKGVGTNAARPK
jgi:hypothetical protein